MLNAKYVMIALMIVLVVGTLNHIFRGLWRITAPKKIDGAEFTFVGQWKARTLGYSLRRESFSPEDFLLGIELDSEGYYKLASPRNLIITISIWLFSAFLIVVIMGDKVLPIYTAWIDSFVS